MPRGKGLGGSGQLNYMLHFDGTQQDFDEWHRRGLDFRDAKKPLVGGAECAPAGYETCLNVDKEKVN